MHHPDTSNPFPASPPSDGEAPEEHGDQLLPSIDLDDESAEPSDASEQASAGRPRATAGARRRTALPSTPALLAWLLLLAPLAWLAMLAVQFDRSSWPQFIGDEAVYQMAAESLAFDRDFRYSTADLERFRNMHQRSPDGLILQSADGGQTMHFGKSWVYPLAIAPFVRLSPSHGVAVANVFYLALASILLAWSLRTIFEQAAPWFVAVFMFGSVAFAHVFWAHSDLFLMSLVAAGSALILQPWLSRARPRTRDHLTRVANRRPKPLSGHAATVAMVLGSGMLAAVVMTRPYYGPLLLIPVLAAETRRAAVSAAVAVGGCLAALLLINVTTIGEWSPYVGNREAFYDYTGFPSTGTPSQGAVETSTADAVRDAAAAVHPAWLDNEEGDGDKSWTGERLLPFPFEPLQYAWNVVYLFIGRHTGLFPYFLPFLLGMLAFRGDRVNWYLLLSLAAIFALFLYARPFNYYGGGGALANRYALPLYPLCLLLARRPIHWSWPAGILALSAVTLLPLWQAPDSFWRNTDGSFHHVSAIAARHLPYETTQNQLKPANREDIQYQAPDGTRLWIKPLSPRIGARSASALELATGTGPAEIVVASTSRFRAFRVLANGDLLHTARFRRPTARHRMWWSFDRHNLYRFDLQGGESLDLGSRPARITIVPVPSS